METILKIKNLTIRIDNSVILKDINLDIYKGEFIGVIGESGSGKTTLAKACLGLIKPYSGSILLYNQEILKLRKGDKRKIGVIFQDPFSSFNPVKNIFYSLVSVLYFVYNIRDIIKIKQIISDLFSKFDLDFELVYRFPYQLSGGQLQRISIIRTLLFNPDIIIADEPTSALDANTKLSIIKILADLNKNGITFVYITHDIGTLKYFEGRIAVMYKGELVEVGNLKESLNNPLHPYLKLLLNKDDCNINENKSVVSEDNVNLNNFRGCVFYFRCRYATNKCKIEKPLLRIYQGRFVACHLLNNSE